MGRRGIVYHLDCPENVVVPITTPFSSANTRNSPNSANNIGDDRYSSLLLPTIHNNHEQFYPKPTR